MSLEVPEMAIDWFERLRRWPDGIISSPVAKSQAKKSLEAARVDLKEKVHETACG